MTRIRHAHAIAEAIRETLAGEPDAEDQAVITETADRTGFSIPQVMAVWDEQFRIVGPC